MTNEPFSKLTCPYCGGENIEPKGKMWWCRDCEQYFEHAQTPAPEEPAKFHGEEIQDGNS
jgi:ribosomal protein L37AE/L43A